MFWLVSFEVYGEASERLDSLIRKRIGSGILEMD